MAISGVKKIYVEPRFGSMKSVEFLCQLLYKYTVVMNLWPSNALIVHRMHAHSPIQAKQDTCGHNTVGKCIPSQLYIVVCEHDYK